MGKDKTEFKVNDFTLTELDTNVMWLSKKGCHNPIPMEKTSFALFLEMVYGSTLVDKDTKPDEPPADQSYI